MGKTTGEPSKFWLRLEEALKEQGRPVGQRAIARQLGMSQGSVQRWYHGDGYPELPTCRKLAGWGKVTVDWLITSRPPKYPISKNPTLSKILEGAESLDDEARKRILQAVRQELIRKAGEGR